MKVPLLVAHRGEARNFPENTLDGVRAALEAGACFVEFDVQLTSDCVPVLLHDADLRRTGDRAARVLDLSFQQLSELEVNQRQIFGERFIGIKVPKLASVVELLMDWPRARAFVEVKPEGIAHFGVRRALERISVDLASAPSRFVLISAVSGFVSEARRHGNSEIGLVLTEWSEEARKKLDELQPDYVFCNLKRIPAEIMLWPGPWKWVVYEVVSPALAMELSVRGAEFVETMAIGEMLADPVLGQRSCRD
jgi:glycerophosphoryl diester phosphodiesterase